LLNNFDVIILAAGLGKRFGCPKIRAKIKDTYFLDYISSLYEISVAKLVVTNIIEYNFALKHFKSYHLAINQNVELGMLYSLQKGIEISSAEYSIIHPIDFLFVKAKTINNLILQYNSDYDIIKPIYNNKGGHPIVINSKVKGSVLQIRDYTLKLNDILKNPNFKTHLLQTDDSGILFNVNTMEDLKNGINKYL